jgi:hypothetical protein
MAQVTTRAVAHDEPLWREIYGSVVSMAFQSLRRGTSGIAGAKDCIIRLLTEEPADGGPKPWQSFIIRNDDGSLLMDTTGSPHKTFREFIESSPLRGLGESVADIERLLADEPEALARLREELVGDRGAPQGNSNASKTKDDNIIICSEPDLFTEPPEKPKCQKQTDQGTRKDYTLSRLKKHAPALFEEVKAGHLSANAAALQAGFRRPMRSIPIDSPGNAIRALLRVFTIDDLLRAVGEIADGRNAE